MKTYLVGGAVRDALLGLSVKERDWVVVGATAGDLLGQGFKQVGMDFPVFLHPETHEEYALARTERKSGKGYTGFETHAGPDVTLEQDLQRRDLTVNAIAQADDGELIDPFGGRADLDARIFRHVSAAFTEDPLRVLRIARFAARFASLGFTVAPETLALMQSMAAAGELEHLVAERVWKECERALGEDSPQAFFQVLHEAQALKVVFPEVDRLFGVPQVPEHHPEVDTGVHVMLALEQACKLNASVAARFAVLTHDLGKGTTPADKWPRHIAHEARGRKLIAALCERLRTPKYFSQLALNVCEFHTHCHRALELRPPKVLTLLNTLGAFRGENMVRDFLIACEADARGRTGFEDRDYAQADYLRGALAECKAVTAAQFAEQGLKGPAIGEAIERERLQVLTQYKKAYVA